MHFSKTQLNKTQSKQTEEEVKEIIVFSSLSHPPLAKYLTQQQQQQQLKFLFL